jgi:hypothetical protein
LKLVGGHTHGGNAERSKVDRHFARRLNGEHRANCKDGQSG